MPTDNILYLILFFKVYDMTNIRGTLRNMLFIYIYIMPALQCIFLEPGIMKIDQMGSGNLLLWQVEILTLLIHFLINMAITNIR